MNIKKVFFPFGKKYSYLSEKWWHRFFVVIFAVSVVLFFISSIFSSYLGIPEKKFNISIQYNLRDFTKTSAKDVVNTIPAFNLMDYKIGCLKDSSINYVSTYDLNNSVCSSDLRGNIDKVADIFMKNNYQFADKTKSQMVQMIAEALEKDTEYRYCFLNQSIGCMSDKIITYKKNFIFYAEVLIASVLATYLYSLILQFVYFRGLIYIIYGKK
jgi:hypothetical protein